MTDSREHEQMQELKEKGNKLLKQNKNFRALELYTEALKVIPQDANLRKQIQITSREVRVHSFVRQDYEIQCWIK